MWLLVLVGVVGGVWGGWKLKHFIDDLRAPQALRPSPADQRIRKALAEGELTDKDLEEIGIDASQFKEGKALVVFDENCCTGLTKDGERCRNRTRAGVDRCWLHPHSRREPQVVVLQEAQQRRLESRISVRTEGAYVDMGTNGAGSLSLEVAGGNISIRVGQWTDGPRRPFTDPMPVEPPYPPGIPAPAMPAAPTQKALPAPPAPPVGHDAGAWRRYDRQVSAYRREIEQCTAEHQRAVEGHRRQCESLERKHQLAVAHRQRKIEAIKREHELKLAHWERARDRWQAGASP